VNAKHRGSTIHGLLAPGVHGLVGDVGAQNLRRSDIWDLKLGDDRGHLPNEFSRLFCLRL